jgi:hypothetical protein
MAEAAAWNSSLSVADFTAFAEQNSRLIDCRDNAC